MNFWLRARLYFHRLTHWEYWPTWVMYIPCYLIYPFYVLYTRAPLYFTAANPGIHMGGSFLSSKNEIYKKLPQQLIPQTMYIDGETQFADCIAFAKRNQLNYPLIAKPDIGEMGLGIKMIDSDSALKDFVTQNVDPYLIQEFIPYEHELGIFLIRKESGEFDITSIVAKEFISLVGDGHKSVEELFLATPRYAMQLEWMKLQEDIDSSQILAKGATLELVRIGNHSRGSIFRDANHLNNQQLRQSMNVSLADFEGFNYGRLDVKYNNFEELLLGKNFSIIELNGVFSEAAHIYDPDFRFLEAWKVTFWHWRTLFHLSLKGIKAGHRPDRLRDEFWNIIYHFRFLAKLRK